MFNPSPNFTEWFRIAKAIGGFATAASVTLGSITPAVAPLAAFVPALAPVAPWLLAAGLLIHGIGTGAKALSDAMQANGMDKQGPK